ncbi:MAG: phage tail protein [Oscillospiraceae bacterium]|jgi:hypothetical protein|nr:phage tail protein [Oscillospiraceae bacterium]
MAQVGCLGDVVFQVSDKAVETISNVQWSGSARYGTHQRHLKDALTEFVGLDPDTISFDMVLSVFLGVDPMTELTKIWQYERTGKAVPMAIGDKGYGKYRWVIEKHKIKLQTFDRYGNLTSATASISLLEYLK